MASFVARNAFAVSDALPRSYFLGHHRAGLGKMKALTSQIDLVFECRDYRVPITSRNPLFEEALQGKRRLLVYTKKDLGSKSTGADQQRENILRKWHHPNEVIFSDYRDPRSARKILDYARKEIASNTKLTGTRAMIMGMPNVGKSSLLNSLRYEGVGKGKAAFTGAQPGVTRKIATSVKIIEGEDEDSSLFLLDTPGVFVPYVPDGEAMLKLALCGLVKDTILPPTVLADYLLFRLNLEDPSSYSEYSLPTNDITRLLERVAQKTGRLSSGGRPDTEASALWLIQRWRNGHFGRFMLDEVSESALRTDSTAGTPESLHQIQKRAKLQRKQAAKNPNK